MGTIVVSYVDKPEGRAALARAARESELRRSSMIVVDNREHAVNSPHPSEPDEELIRCSERLQAEGLRCEVRHLEPDQEVADGINDLAEALDAEMIVIGLRRRSPVGKLMLGHHAQRILLDASCPVLTVKAPDGEPGRSRSSEHQTGRETGKAGVIGEMEDDR